MPTHPWLADKKMRLLAALVHIKLSLFLLEEEVSVLMCIAYGGSGGDATITINFS